MRIHHSHQLYTQYYYKDTNLSQHVNNNLILQFSDGLEQGGRLDKLTDTRKGQ